MIENYVKVSAREDDGECSADAVTGDRAGDPDTEPLAA